jgi:hypothetical protein
MLRCRRVESADIGGGHTIYHIKRFVACQHGGCATHPYSDVAAGFAGRLHYLYTGGFALQGFGGRNHRAVADVFFIDDDHGGGQVFFPLRAVTIGLKN